MTAMTIDQVTAWMSAHMPRVEVMIGSTLIAIVALVAISYISKLLFRLLLGLRSRLRLSYESTLFIVRCAVFALWVSVGLLLLSYWGISVTGLWTVMMSVAAVIGVGFLAVWTMVSNITANLFLTIWRPFHMGAMVEILPENLSGRVVDRNMMFTVLREKDGGKLWVPNNLFFQKVFRVHDTKQMHTYEYFEREAGEENIPPASNL